MPPPRLSAVDASFLYLERPRTPMHVGAVGIFQVPAGGFDYERLVETVERRLVQVPRYRQRVRHVPGNLARPVWVDDGDFDVAFHVRRSALPRPGTEAQLTELVARLLARPLDPDRPLWEVYLVEGLSDGRFAVITKTHQAMVDGVTTVDIGQVLLDPTPEPPEAPEQLWMPRTEPTDAALVADAVAEAVARPGEVVDTLRFAANDAAAAVVGVARGVGALVGTVARGGRLAPGSPLNVEVSGRRRFAVARGSLERYREVRTAHGCTVNDVVLAVVTGALRTWLLSRGEPVTSGSRVRAMVPLWTRPAPHQGDVPSAAGERVHSTLVDLPVGEPSPVLRLQHIAYAMREHTAGGRTVRAAALARIGGHAPPTLHALGARAVHGISRRIFNLVVTNVPGPQVPLYAAGARMLETFPVVPLAMGQGLAIGITSYDGGLYYGFNADRDAMPDLDVLATTVDESLDELLATVG
jgi:diacylglycerol O-acyltransferase / wax synthase